MTTTNRPKRIALFLILLFTALGITLANATTEDNYKNETNLHPRIYESTHTENGYKANIIVNPITTGIHAKENGYNLDFAINPKGIGGSHSENNYKLDLIPEKTFPRILDVAVTNVIPSKTVVGQGYNTTIEATIENKGFYFETFYVTTYYGTIPNGDMPNGDFEKDPTGTSYNNITNWNCHTIVHKGNPPTGDDLQIVDDYCFKGDKSLYSYLKTTSVPPFPGDSVASQCLSTEEPVFTTADYISLWIGGDGYTTSSRYYWWIELILTDGNNTYHEELRCDCWGNNEGCNPNHFDYYNATETGADGNTWKRYTKRIPDSLDKSNLTVTLRHRQSSWDLTTASSWYRLDNIYFSDSEGNPHVHYVIPIETKTVTLTTRNSTTITFRWNTTGVAKGNYTITAKATPLPGETDTTDNTLTNGWILVTIPGDANGDYRVDAFDARALGLAWPPQPYEPNVDFNSDDRIDSLDVRILGENWGKSW